MYTHTYGDDTSLDRQVTELQAYTRAPITNLTKWHTMHPTGAHIGRGKHVLQVNTLNNSPTPSTCQIVKLPLQIKQITFLLAATNLQIVTLNCNHILPPEQIRNKGSRWVRS